MTKKILKVWNFWVDGMLYHDQYLDRYMRQKGIITYFCCPNFAPESFKNYMTTSKHMPGDFKLLWMDYVNLIGKPFTYNIFQMARYLKKINPDIIHIFGISNFTTILTFIAIILTRYQGDIYVNDHSDPNNRNRSLLGKFYLQFFRSIFNLFKYKINLIIVPDEASKNELKSRYGNKIYSKLKVIPLGYDSNIYYYKPDQDRYSGNTLNIGFAGKINKSKNLDLLLDCIEKVKVGSVSLEIAGFRNLQASNYEYELLERVTKSKHNIKCSKFIQSPADLATFYRSKDLIIFPGSISITTLEATGVGTPIILYESYEGLGHRVSGGRGHLFETEEQLLKLIHHYVLEQNQYRSLRENISNQSLEYSWEKITLMYLDIYGWEVC